MTTFHMRFLGLAAACLMAFSTMAASQVSGNLTVAGDRVELTSAIAMALKDTQGSPFIAVLFSEAPVDVSDVLASDDPQVELIVLDALKGITYALLFLTPRENHMEATKASDGMQYSVSEGLGLETRISGGTGEPLRGSVRTTHAEFLVQMEVTFEIPVLHRSGGG